MCTNLLIRLAGTSAKLAGACLLASVLLAQNNPPIAGQNVNMVSGVTLADGDPFLTKQNEPSMAVSSVNPMHLLAGANDYRLIPLAQSLDVPGEGLGADSWVGLFKSVDGGRTWRSTVVSGCPLNIAQCNSPLSAAIKGLQYASDPTVRPGPYGTFFYSFIAGIRGTGSGSVIAVQRFFDLNNNVKFTDDPFQADKLSILDKGTTGQFKDKPWNAADIPGRPWNANKTCALPTAGGNVPAFNVYVSYANFVGQSAGNQHPQIVVATSSDCGATFAKPVKISESVTTNQGTTMAIDPATGAVYVIWRQFGTPGTNSPDAIYFSKSTNGGGTWTKPALIANNITPFEQETTSTAFRAEAFPTATVSVYNGVSRVHVAWSERGVGPGGAARIVMTTSSNGGGTWPAPVAVDNNFQNQTVPYAGGPSAPSWAAFNPYNASGFGHQFQPALTFAAGKLTLLWQDQRLDHTVGVIDCSAAPPVHGIRQCTEVRMARKSNSGLTDSLAKVFTEDITDGTPGMLFRHTLDVFGGQAVPSDQPVFATTRVSNYLYGSSTLGTSITDPVRTPKQIRQLRFNVPNVPIFVNGTKPFLGDYNDVAAQIMIPTGNPQQPYIWNISALNKTVFHGAFTSNQDVVPPSSGNWAAYTPVMTLDASGNLVPNGTCVPGQEGTQNQNVYTAPIFEGIDAYAVVNSKYLSSSTARAFNIVVQNGTANPVTMSLSIANQPSGGGAGFKVTGGVISLTSVLLNIGPSSSITRSVWVKANSPGASVTVNVNQTGANGQNPVPVTSVVLNPDSSATIATALPAPSSGDVININQSDVSVETNDLSNNDLSNNDLSNNDLSNNDLSNNDLSNNDLSNNDLSNAAVMVNDLSNNDLSNNDLSNNDLSNNDLSNNDLSNNDLSNNDLSNAGVVGATFTLFNNSPSTDVGLNVKSLMRGGQIPNGYKVQLIVHKTYTTQTAAACRFVKVQQNIPVINIPAPAITAVSALSAPNIGDSWVNDPSDKNPSLSLMPREIARISFRLVKNGGTRSDNTTIDEEFGANGVKAVTINPSTTIVPVPLVIDTLSLPDATAGQPYSQTLQVSGGLPPLTWSLIGGTLPAGFNAFGPSATLGGTPTQAGIYSLTFQVVDTPVNGKQQTDKQTLSLIVHGTQSVTFPAATLVFGTPVALSLTSSAGLPVSYSVTSGPCTLVNNVVTANSGSGTCRITATQAGNQIWFPFSGYQDFTLNKATPTITLSGGTFPYDGKAHPATASVIGAGGASLGSPVLTYTPPGNATAPVNTGGYTVTASFAGNANYNPASGGPVALTIVKATPVFSGLSSPTVTAGTPAVVGGTISYSSVFPTGNVVITIGSVTKLAAIGPTGAFSASFNTADAAIGPITITYKYAGDANFTAAADGSGTLTVVRP